MRGTTNSRKELQEGTPGRNSRNIVPSTPTSADCRTVICSSQASRCAGSTEKLLRVLLLVTRVPITFSGDAPTKPRRRPRRAPRRPRRSRRLTTGTACPAIMPPNGCGAGEVGLLDPRRRSQGGWRRGWRTSARRPEYPGTATMGHCCCSQLKTSVPRRQHERDRPDHR
jgi:hypothetical protein